MSVASGAANVDWGVVATGIATFIVALWATWQGLQKGKGKVEGGEHVTGIVGGTLMDNMTMRDLTEALRDNTEAVNRQTHILERSHDLLVIQIGRGIIKPD